MRKIQLISMLAGGSLLFWQLAAFAGVALAPATVDQYVPGQVLVKFKSGVAAAMRTQLAQTYGVQAVRTLGGQNDLLLVDLIHGQPVDQTITSIAADPSVEYAQPNFIYRKQAVPTDPLYGQLWAAKNTGQTIASGTYAITTGTAGADMNLESAWGVQTDCSSVLVAVIDTGINYNATDLTANMWSDATDTMHGRNFAPDVATGANSNPMDLDGHGTHVAGIIAAAANNGAGGVGVCWSAKLLAVRVLGSGGVGSTATIVAGIDYAIGKGAKVLNMSLGGAGSFDQAFSDAITRAQNSNALVVVAAANDSQNNDITPHWPCNFTQANLICVAALDQNYALTTFSDYGATTVDVGAPGSNILSTWAGTNNVITDNFSAGWTFSSTTSGAGGGWAVNNYAGVNWLEVPGVSWGTALYNASTDDRAYKTFNLSGVNVAIVDVVAAINVKNLDYFQVNYSSAGGDPSAGTLGARYTNIHDGTAYASSINPVDVTQCISATCSIGFQLVSNATAPKDFGVTLMNFKISTLTLNSTSYNTINGTSMATPEVTGVAALVWAYNPLYTYADVANAIRNGGRSVPSLSGKTTTGKAVDAMGSLAYINPPTGVSVVVH